MLSGDQVTKADLIRKAELIESIIDELEPLTRSEAEVWDAVCEAIAAVEVDLEGRLWRLDIGS
jgi:hypothetical protein